LALAVTASGALFWGEYWSNRERKPVHVYGSLDGGRTWEIVYTFGAGSIRHIHNIIYDRFADCLWVLTGDTDSESRIIRARPDWREVHTVLGGSQQARVVGLVPMSKALYYATDTPWEGNHIYRFERDGAPEPLLAISGSVMQGCRVGEALFFSTAVEPSRVNRCPFSCLYGSADGQSWKELRQWRADLWSGQLFQYGRVLLPRGENGTDILAGTSVGVRRHDNVMHAWRVAESP
jgi:hypothetical protein